MNNTLRLLMAKLLIIVIIAMSIVTVVTHLPWWQNLINFSATAVFVKYELDK